MADISTVTDFQVLFKLRLPPDSSLFWAVLPYFSMLIFLFSQLPGWHFWHTHTVAVQTAEKHTHCTQRHKKIFFAAWKAVTRDYISVHSGHGWRVPLEHVLPPRMMREFPRPRFVIPPDMASQHEPGLVLIFSSHIYHLWPCTHICNYFCTIQNTFVRF